jgi:hypothetical protein
MTDTIRRHRTRCASPSRGFSSLQKSLFGVLAFFFAIHPAFWYLEFHAGVPQDVASTAMVLVVIGCFVTALVLPWIAFADQRTRTRSERFSAMVIVWVFIALIPRFIWELPWLLLFNQIRAGVENGSIWTYMWSAILLGGDARYLNADPLIVCLEWIALFAGLFEAYALVQFFRNGKRFSSTQLSLIMAGMIVEVTLPAVYFGVEIANNLRSMSSPVEMWVKFVLINVLWCIMPLVTYFWGVRRLVSQDLAVRF